MSDIYYEQIHFPEINARGLAVINYNNYLKEKTQVRSHWHTAVEISMVISNTLVLYTGGKAIEISEGDFAYVNSGEVHSAEILYKDEWVKGVVILLSDQMFRSLCPDFNQYRLLIPADDPGRKEIIASLEKIYMHKKNPSPYDQALINAELWRIVYLLMAFLVPKEEKALPAQEGRDFLARQAMEYIDHNFLADLNLSQVAKQVRLQENYFCRYFKKHTGMSFSQYLARARLRYALAYMLDFGASVADSAVQAGFPSAKSFTDWCRRIYGVTPAQYKRQQMEQEVQENIK